MYKPYPNGSVVALCFDDEIYKINIPAPGWVRDYYTGDMKRVVINDADAPMEERYFKRTPLPKKWKDWLREERIRNENIDDEYEDKLGQ